MVAAAAAACAALATRLLKAGHPLQLEFPPVPSQCPSPGQVPSAAREPVAAAMSTATANDESFALSLFIERTSLTAVADDTEEFRFMFVGRAVCRAFSYSPQALQMIFPLISRLHSGVDVVPQFLSLVLITCGRIRAELP